MSCVRFASLIPTFLVSRLAKETGVDKKARTFTCWSHLVAMLYAQLTHVISLNDLCDGLKIFSGPLSAIRGAVAPSRNGLSHANRERDPKLAEKLLWAMLDHLQSLSPKFATGQRRLPRFKRSIQAVDGTVICLIANCMSWAKHRRRKAATKLHLRLDLQTHLPRYAVVDLAPHHDHTRAAEVCAGLKDGEIAIFDKAYVAFGHLWQLTLRGVFWVSRPQGQPGLSGEQAAFEKAPGQNPAGRFNRLAWSQVQKTLPGEAAPDRGLGHDGRPGSADGVFNQ